MFSIFTGEEYRWMRRHINPVFAPVYFDHRREPEPTGPLDPSTAPAQQKKTGPLAAAPTPAKFYSQYSCPICNDPISHQHNADYIGNFPCLHRGPCVKPDCIRAFYGVEDKWASPYRGRKHLFCQAPGCGTEIEGWTYVQAVQTPMMQELGVVMPRVVRGPNWPMGPGWSGPDVRSQMWEMYRIECGDGCGWITEGPRHHYRWSLEMPPLAPVYGLDGEERDPAVFFEEGGLLLVRFPLVKVAEMDAAVDEYGVDVVRAVVCLRGLADWHQTTRDVVSGKTFALLCDMECELRSLKPNRFKRSFQSIRVSLRMALRGAVQGKDLNRDLDRYLDSRWVN